jgi:hypothetical protein
MKVPNIHYLLTGVKEEWLRSILLAQYKNSSQGYFLQQLKSVSNRRKVF